MGKITSLKRRAKSSFSKKTFMSKNKTKRGDAVVYVKEKIRRSMHIYGNLFTSRQVIEGSGRPEFMDNSASFEFLSRDKHRFWNAYIITASKAFDDEVSSIALQETSDIIKASGYVEPEFDIFLFIRSLNDRSLRKPDVVHEVLGNLTEKEYRLVLEDKIIKNNPPSIFESVKFDMRFESGCGLYIVVDAPRITNEVINAFIVSFINGGELEYSSDTPVARHRLPAETFRTMMDHAQVPGFLIGNELRDPLTRGVWKSGKFRKQK